VAVRQFKAESKRLLDLMINSIYTHKEIFLRELISNASDAIDKLYFRSLTDESVKMSRQDFAVRISVDRENRVLTISDNGCGMTKTDLENNLGTIAKSGSLAFKNENQSDEIDVIGQFGVGFYSAFMVSSEVTVISRSFGSDEAYCWRSKGAEGYTVTPCQKENAGTDVILKIKENTENENYDEFLESYRISALVKKYSDYIRYPILMDVEKSRPVEGKENEFETHLETQTLNSMVPIWKKNKSELKAEDYNEFYKQKFFDFEDPICHIHSSTEGAATYQAMLFIPQKAPHNYYSKDYEKGLQLYASGVLIMDRCADLLPDHFSFVRGLVDSQDLSLNISREMLQHDRQLKLIATSLEKKIKNELLRLMKNEREKYDAFFKAFGLQLKFGVYDRFGANKEELQDLLEFYSAKQDKLVSLAEYVDAMPESQQYIYYACGESEQRIKNLPSIELVLEKGYDVLCLTQDVDEFALKALVKYNDKEFRSAAEEDLGLNDEESKKKIEELGEQNKQLLEAVKETLKDDVNSVKLSARLKTHPVCISSEGDITLEMEKVLNAMPTGEKIRAKRVLEINPDHEIFALLKTLFENNRQKFDDYCKLLYMQALLVEGMEISEPVEFSELICKLMAENA